MTTNMQASKEQLQRSPYASQWLQQAIRQQLDRNIVDALRDTRALLRLLEREYLLEQQPQQKQQQQQPQ